MVYEKYFAIEENERENSKDKRLMKLMDYYDELSLMTMNCYQWIKESLIRRNTIIL